MAASTTSAGGMPGRVRVSLTVRGANLNPDELSRKLQCAADYSHRRGEPRQKGAAYADSVWEITLTSDGESSIGDLIDRLLDRLPTQTAWEGSDPGLRVTLGLYVLLTSENQDFVIPPRQLARLVGMGAELWCDIYSASSP